MSADPHVEDTPFDSKREALAGMRLLRERGFTLSNLRSVVRDAALSIAFGIEGAGEPGFKIRSGLREGRLFTGGVDINDFIEPSQDKIDALKAAGKEYTPIPDWAKKALLDAEQALLNGATAASVITPGCDGTNFLQVITIDPVTGETHRKNQS